MSNAEKKAAVDVESPEEDELEFELIMSARQLAPPPPLRNQLVEVPEWPTTSGKAAKFLVWELTASDYADFFESGWTYKDGARQRYDNAGEDARFLAHVLRDKNGNRLWHKTEDAKAILDRLGKGITNRLLAAAMELNSGKEAGREGNSGKTESDS